MNFVKQADHDPLPAGRRAHNILLGCSNRFEDQPGGHRSVGEVRASKGTGRDYDPTRQEASPTARVLIAA